MSRDKSDYSKLSYAVTKLGALLLLLFFWFVFAYLVSQITWWLLLIIGIPFYFLFEFLGQKIFAEKYGWSTSQVGFSITRIIVGILSVLLFGFIFFFLFG